MTLSVVDEAASASMRPWTDAEPLRSLMPVIRGADCLRRSLVPSLLAAGERTNRWPIRRSSCSRSPRFICRRARICREEVMLAIASGREYPVVKGAIETILAELKIAVPMAAGDAGLSILDPAASCGLQLGGERFGYVGRLTQEAMRQFDLRGPAVVAEVRLGPLVEEADLVPRCVAQSPYPAVTAI